MSTRANVVISDQYGEIWFYRHSDGYPEGTMPTLEKFLGYVKDGRIRDNASQAAGWLVLIGAQEYASDEFGYMNGTIALKDQAPGKADSMMGWKIGAYEPTTSQHGDIDYLYRIDLVAKSIKIEEV